MAALRVFIASATEWAFVAHSLKARLEGDYGNEFYVLDWQSSFSPGRTPVLDNLLRAIEEVDFGVFVLAPSEVTRPQESEADEDGHLMARANVLIELGVFIGRHGRDRVYLITPAPDAHELPFWIPSDVHKQLPGSEVAFKSLRRAQEAGGQRGQDTGKAALMSVIDDLVARFETVTAESLTRTAPHEPRRTERKSVERKSSWSARFQLLDAGSVGPGDPVLHPLFGVGTFVESQTIAGRAYFLVAFSDATRRLPADDSLFDPFQAGHD
jgi:hypothetical protein